MYLSFVLSMPNNNSWNGKWSGEERFYAKVENFKGKKNEEKATTILEKGYFYYNFGDGWGAGVSVEEIDSAKARKIRRKSNGFCGYDWMIQEIKDHGRILTLKERASK